MSADNPKPPVMKLKLTNNAGPKPPPDASAQSPSAQTPGGHSIKLKFKPASAANTPVHENAPAQLLPGAPAQLPPPAKPKRKYTKKEKSGDAGTAAPKASKKRARDANDNDGATSSAKKSRPSLSLKTSNAGVPHAPLRTHSISLKLKNTTPKTPNVPRIKMKHVGQPPPRPLGVGYDSEAEEAEVDPAIEHQFILRMMPGPDCDYLHKAISERKVGLALREGGADVQFRFFDREGRRACVTIQGRHYAASLVDLPCVVEGMKSWEKKGGWFKTADICQMLLVYALVEKEEQAKECALPKEIDEKTWQYPHGLTPPMHYVRKRRFRKRVSFRTIEAVEEEVERLLALDEKAKDAGGNTDYELIDLNRHGRDETSSQVGDDEAPEYEQQLLNDQQAQVDENGNYYMDAEGEDDDDAAMAALMEQELGADEDEPITSVEAPTANDIDAAHAVAQHALGEAIASTPVGADSTPAATPDASAAETEASESESDADEDDEIDEAAQAAQEMKAQLREEVADLQREVETAKMQMERQNNPLLKNRLMAKFKSLQSDLELKKASLGEGDDDDDE